MNRRSFVERLSIALIAIVGVRRVQPEPQLCGETPRISIGEFVVRCNRPAGHTGLHCCEFPGGGMIEWPLSVGPGERPTPWTVNQIGGAVADLGHSPFAIQRRHIYSPPLKWSSTHEPS